MLSPTLAPDATITDILDGLDDPEDYVRGVLGNMSECRKRHGDSCVRIGTTGHGIAPHYRVEPRDDGDDDDDDFRRIINNIDAYYVAFHGRNHRKLDWGMLQLKGDHWSTRPMSFDDVQALLGKIRNIGR